jgi:hypothetical protein
VVFNTYCVVFICFVCLHLVYPMLPVSLDCPYLISPSLFSIIIFISYLLKIFKFKFESCSWRGVLDTTLCDQGTNKKMEHSIVRSDLAIYEHERLLSTITQIQIMENYFVLMFYISVTIGLSRISIKHALK